LRSVSKAYNGRQVLSIPELDIHCGEVFAIVGPSGAGKSTLLRLLNFLEPPDSGVIRFRGHEFGPGQAMPLELRRRVTTVFQSPMLLNRSVWDNIRYGLWVRGRRDSARLVAGTLEQVGLSAFARQRARTLSGGEAQRVALARAMVLELDALLLDEPTANLDPHNVALIEDIVRTLNRGKGTTLVLVTHNIFQARRLADRVGLMLDGGLIEVADVETFFEQPGDPRTAAFVRGDMVY
jgi:tungstate transport system ATP-binding protein